MRFLLALMAARSTAGFVQFIVAVTNPFYAPFQRNRCQPQHRSGAHVDDADRHCDHRLSPAASGDQRIAANAGASQNSDLTLPIARCRLPICDWRAD